MCNYLVFTQAALRVKNRQGVLMARGLEVVGHYGVGRRDQERVGSGRHRSRNGVSSAQQRILQLLDQLIPQLSLHRRNTAKDPLHKSEEKQDDVQGHLLTLSVSSTPLLLKVW